MLFRSLSSGDIATDDRFFRIHTNTPFAAAAPASSGSRNNTGSSSDVEGSKLDLYSEGSDDDNKPYIPSPIKPSSSKIVPRPVQTQSKLRSNDDKLVKFQPNKSKGKLKAGVPRATLVVAPMTLLSQWCQELQRSSKGGMNVLMYYGADRTSIQEEIEGGVEVVVTR